MLMVVSFTVVAFLLWHVSARRAHRRGFTLGSLTVRHNVERFVESLSGAEKLRFRTLWIQWNRQRLKAMNGKKIDDKRDKL